MKTGIIHHQKLSDYDFGEGHPFRGDRFAAFLALWHQQLAENPSFSLTENKDLASDEELQLWHTNEYIQAMQAASSGEAVPGWQRFASADNVNPLTGGMPLGIEEAARAAVKNSIFAVDLVQDGTYEKAVSLGGGLHHAMPDYGEGFCIYNDVVIAARYAMQEYALERVLILDTDAHAGNGTCAAFYGDERVLFIDMHQRDIYPGSGQAHEIGEGAGKGYTVNVPLAGGTGEASYQLIFEELIGPLAHEFQPQLIMRYGGSDPHHADSITSLGLTLAGFQLIGERVRELSQDLCQGRAVDLICSGYNLQVLAQAWLALIAALGGAPLSLEEKRPRQSHDRVQETKRLLAELRQRLKPFWRCMQ